MVAPWVLPGVAYPVLVGGAVLLALSRETKRGLLIPASISVTAVILGLLPPAAFVNVAPLHFLASVGGVMAGIRPRGWSARDVFLGGLIAFVGLNLWTAAALSTDGDEPVYLLHAESLLRDGDVLLQNNIRETHYRDYLTTYELDPRMFPPNRDLKLGYSMVLTLGFSLGRRVGAALQMAIVAAALGLMLFCWLRDLHFKDRPAAWAVGTILFLSPVVLYAGHFFPEVCAGLLLVTGLWATERIHPGYRIVSLGAVVALMLLHTRFIPAAVALLGVAVVRGLPRKVAAGTVIVLPLVVAGYLGIDAWLFDGALILSKHLRGTTLDAVLSLDGRHVLATLGLLFDQEFGLLTVWPVFLLTVPGLYLLREHRDGWRRMWPSLIVIALGLGSVIILRRAFWHGGYNPPGRFLVAYLPLLAPFLAKVYSRRDLLHRGAAKVLVAWSVVGSLVVTVVPAWRYSPGVGRATWARFLAQRTGLNVAPWLPSYLRVNEVSAAWNGAIWLLVTCLLAVYLWRRRWRWTVVATPLTLGALAVPFLPFASVAVHEPEDAPGTLDAHDRHYPPHLGSRLVLPIKQPELQRALTALHADLPGDPTWQGLVDTLGRDTSQLSANLSPGPTSVGVRYPAGTTLTPEVAPEGAEGMLLLRVMGRPNACAGVQVRLWHGRLLSSFPLRSTTYRSLEQPLAPNSGPIQLHVDGCGSGGEVILDRLAWYPPRPRIGRAMALLGDILPEGTGGRFFREGGRHFLGMTPTPRERLMEMLPGGHHGAPDVDSVFSQPEDVEALTDYLRQAPCGSYRPEVGQSAVLRDLTALQRPLAMASLPTWLFWGPRYALLPETLILYEAPPVTMPLLLPPGDYRAAFDAKGFMAEDRWPELELLIDGNPVASFVIDHDAWEAHGASFRLEEPGSCIGLRLSSEPLWSQHLAHFTSVRNITIQRRGR